MLTNEHWTEDAAAAAERNHIWLNAFACVRPTDEFLRDVGRMVLDKFADRESLIQPRISLVESERDLIIRFNKS